MPTPLELIRDPVSLSIFALYGALILWETMLPARAMPEIKGWKPRGLIAFSLYFALSSYLPLLWSEQLATWQLLDLRELETWSAAGAGLLVYESAVYLWHRAMHRYKLLWRTFHQMHHSAERLDAYGAFWFSPLDMVGWTVLFSLSMTLIGFTPEAVTLTLLFSTFLSVFQHSNIRTPRWLGYIVQRPESHSRHHARNVHAGNYADLPLLDILFGTFYNPARFSEEAGFYDGASRRVRDMLMFRDISKPRS
jgi:sterol desaturase/sphingolipid hydroxylase (fatty acid hydroxylase superfamily)